MSTGLDRSRFRLSYLILGVCVAAAVGSHGYSLWMASEQEQRMLPRLALNTLVKALRSYHHKFGKFPESFAEVEKRIWRRKQTPNFGDNGRSLSLANYYYLYYPAEPSVCTIWAIPTGRRREEGSTVFVILTTEAMRRWKGAPLALEEIRRLKSVPSHSELAVLGLIEQQPIQSKTGRKAASQ